MKNENTNELPSFSTNEKLDNPSAFPFTVEYSNGHKVNKGMILRDYFATKAKDDFDDLDYDLKELIVGRKCPDKVLKQKADPNIPFEFDVYTPTMEYVQWIAEGRAKWKFIQAVAMLKQREQ